MTNQDIKDRLSRILETVLQVAPEEIIDSARIIEDLAADSLDIVEITMNVEEEFGILISDAEMEDATTVADLAGIVDRELA